MRWYQILELAEDRIRRRFSGDKALAVGDVAISVIDAYGDDWLDREFYRRYNKAVSEG
jgi:hypothetical protein